MPNAADIKIVFFDIDGTLVDPATGCISPKTCETVRSLRKKGILVCIATGRAPAGLPDFGDLEFDAMATFNGSLCCTAHETIHSDPIHPSDVQKVLQNAAGIGRPVSLAVRDRLAANGWDEDLSDYYRLAGLELTASEDFDQACQEDVYQIMVGCRPSEHEALIQGVEGVKIAISWDRAVDIIPARSGKNAAISQILAYYHLSPSQALAFGDGLNDTEMLQAVGTGIAMGNAAPQLKAIADEVCGTVSENGIYHYCLQHELI